jgi:hypothetical protein
MQYMILIYGDEQIYANMDKAALGQMMEGYGAYTAAMQEAGVLRGGSELAPVSSASTVRIRAGKTIVTDGPFAETKEQMGGYYLIETADLDQALAWAAKCPSADTGSIEVRPLV